MKTRDPSTRVPEALMAILVVLLLALSVATASADPQPSPSAASEPPPVRVTLTATLASPSVAAGGLIIIEGTLKDQDGDPVNGARITVMLDDKESSDSLVMTDETGAFQTFAEVPSKRQPGEASLVVTFAGNNTYEAASQEIRLAVDEIPMGEGTAPEATPTPLDAADISPSTDPSTVTVGMEDAAEEMPDRDSAPLSWFYVALVVVAGAALLVTAGLVIRGIYGRGGEPVPRRPGSLDMLLDQAAEDDEKPDGPR